MLIEQTVVGKQLVHVVTVVEALLDATHKHLHLRCAIIRRDTLSESTILATILKRHHQLVVVLQGVEHVDVHGVQIARIDERGVNALRDDLIAHRTTVQGVKANHSAADNVAGGYVDDNLGKDVASRDYDVPEASAAQLQYKVSLTEDVPLYFLRVFVADKTRSVGAASTAAIIGKGKAANSKHLFVFKDGMGEVNSINNPDNMNIKGQISSTFDGDIAYTDGVTSGAPDYTPVANPSYFPPQGIEYSSQNADLKYFFTKQAADENCSVTEAEANGYVHQASYTAYDMDALHRQVTAMTQVRYTNGQNPDSSEAIFDQNTSTAIYIKEPNVNLSVNRLPGSDTHPEMLIEFLLET